MTARRFSSLPMAEICGASATLAKQSNWRMREGQIGTAYHLWFESTYASDEIAAVGAKKAFEAMLVGMIEEDRDALAGLTNETRLNFSPPWKPGTPLEMELKLALNEHREPVPYDDEEAVGRGTLDVAWIEPRGPENTPTAVVVDHKTGHWVDVKRYTLQLLGYAIAFARLRGIGQIAVYVHVVRDAKSVALRFDEDADGNPIYVLDLDSPEGSAAWQRVLVACTNDDAGFVTGSHCSDCFQRMHCPARMLPASALVEKLAPINKGEDMSKEEACAALVAASAMADMAKNAVEAIQTFVRLRGPLVDGGRVYEVSETKGRRSAKVDALIAAGLTEYVTVGEPGIRFGWHNVGRGKR